MKLLNFIIITGSIFFNLMFHPIPSFAKDSDEHIAGVCYEFIDQNGRVITLTSRKPFKGDEIITEKGDHFKVISVQNQTARVNLTGKDNAYLAMMDYYSQFKTIPVSTQPWFERPVGIYHTHSDESYLPTDGAASIPFKGGIFQVGAIFNAELRERRVNASHDKTPHDPHDANAYYRSRRTVLKLLKQNPVALFDVHRDGIDNPDFYRRIITNRDVTQIRLVVGRQNPKMSANLDFAKRLMAFVNQKNPGLVKEIYMAHGNYNQDLLSTALLIEAGTYTNEKKEAESGVALLAGAVPIMLGLTPPEKGITSPKAGHQGWKTTFLIIALVILAGIVFVIINSPEGKIREYIYKKAKNLVRRQE